ncbi:MAG: PhoH family protein, partial [Porphyromonas asaccharolytica]
ARGRSIGYRGAHQREMVEAIADHDMLFAIGPAGTGKTYIAIALAVKALKEKQVRRIILSRPAVEAGEKLGFLPGELKDKLDPYLQPLYDALEEMIPTQRLRTYMESDVIQIAPLAYMRGRTLNDAVVILDEAQNTTHHQMKMFLTRLGRNSKMIITGDLSQVDLPRGVTSGLRIAERILSDVEQIPFVYFDAQDIVRHPIVQLVVDAYDRNEHQALQGGRPTQETLQQQDIDLDKDQSKDS